MTMRPLQDQREPTRLHPLLQGLLCLVVAAVTLPIVGKFGVVILAGVCWALITIATRVGRASW